jgi:hypothetical protein
MSTSAGVQAGPAPEGSLADSPDAPAFERASLSADFPEFLTLVAYDKLED